jgi:hypothetical protein
MRLVVVGLICLSAVSAFAQEQSRPILEGCTYPKDVPEQQAVAESVMQLTLPYLDKQFIYYRDGNGTPTGAYAIRRSLRIYFYDKNNALMGTATRRSQVQTSYFDPAGNYVGRCINQKLVTPDDRPVRFDPAQR